MNIALTCVSALAWMLHTGTGWTLAFMPSFKSTQQATGSVNSHGLGDEDGVHNLDIGFAGAYV